MMDRLHLTFNFPPFRIVCDSRAQRSSIQCSVLFPFELSRVAMVAYIRLVIFKKTAENHHQMYGLCDVQSINTDVSTSQ